MYEDERSPHWLDNYASQKFRWRDTIVNGRRTFHRPLGLVEFAFDADGRYHEGRADINTSLELQVRSTLGHHDFRERILLAWTCLRCRHLLLQAKALPTNTITGHATASPTDVSFVISLPHTRSVAVEDAGDQLVFLEDHYQSVDPLDFWSHCQNTSRIFDPAKTLAKLFVLPLESWDGNSALRLLFVGSHQIWDGLTTYVWLRDFVHLLNCNINTLAQHLTESLSEEKVRSHLPLPQEALYPPISGSDARKRWYWVLTRILRHVRKPLQPGFSNPMRRCVSLQAVAPSPTYAAVLDYTKTPLLNSYPGIVTLPPHHTQHLHHLCRQAGVSIGAGCFALSAIVMMEMYEELNPDIPLRERRPFISGFPLNPSAFFNHHNEPDSLMLAFSDGIALPFLSSSLPLDGRIRLLARQAQRQLASYQKRPRISATKADIRSMGSRGAGRVLAIQYVSSVERMDSILPEHLRKGVSPQGAYPMRPNSTAQTCGVSSVGRRDAIIKRGMYDVNDGSKDFVADYRDIMSGVRPRDGEFLIGIGGDDNGLYINASIDASSMDAALVQQWKYKLQHILNEEVKVWETKL